MNKRQARLFAVVATLLSAALFAALTLDSHRRFPALTRAENLTPEVIHGKAVWHKYNCINCHTLFGEGAYYAPDLTKITQHRGEAYLQAYMRDPSNFYDEERHRRLMPRQDLSEQEIEDLIAFLDWVANVDNQGWPPRPILVTGAMVQPSGFDDTTAPQDDAEQGAARADTAKPVRPTSDPRAIGENLFRTATPPCTACHSLQPGVQMAGPSLAGLAARAAELVASGEYAGGSADAEGYIRESIVAPSAHLVPGSSFSANGVSFMPDTYAESLGPEQIDQLVAFLASLR